MSVGQRLARLLFIVPYAAQRDGVPLAELAQKLDVSPRQIEADLELLAMVGQPPLTPDHLVDLYLEDNIVYVDLHQNLSRPLRLTHDEARALIFALHWVGSTGTQGTTLDALVARLLQHLNPDEVMMLQNLRHRVGMWQEHDGLEDAMAMLRSAVENHRELVLDYYSASSDQKKNYRLRPLALLSHSGIDYLVAQDITAQLRQKLFRVDRMGVIDVTPTHFEAPKSVDLEQFRTPSLYQGDDNSRARVRFGPSSARLVRERFLEHQITDLPDGSVEAQLATSSQAWLARWVLPFGTDAEILEPAEQRQRLGAFCLEAAKCYGAL